MQLPAHRGPISAQVRTLICEPGEGLDLDPQLLRRIHRQTPRAIEDEDIQLALAMLYELHYRGFEGVREDAEWDLQLLAIRAELEKAFLADLATRVDMPDVPSPNELPELMFAMTTEASGPSLSKYLAHKATDEQIREFIIHRSAYQSKEADPYNWAIPRLMPAAKAALVEIQNDEYGAGHVDRMHQELYRKTLRSLDIDDSYGGLIDLLPAVSLANGNLVSLFGLHRRYRAALCGHFAALEMTSSIPNRRYGDGLRRLGYGEETTDFYDEHVEADAVHEQLAVRNLCAGLVADEPDQLHNVIFGVASYLALEKALGDYLFNEWAAQRSSLRAGRIPSVHATDPLARTVSLVNSPTESQV